MNDEWYYGEDGQQRGPVPIEALRERIARGTIGGDDLVWRAGLPEWLPASRVPELADAFRAPPPPSVGPPPFVHGAPASQTSVGPPHVGHQTQPVAPYDPISRSLQSKANTSLVLGIASIVLGPCCCSPIGMVVAILAIIVGRNARGAPNAGTASAGVICGIVGLVLNVTSCGGQAVYHTRHPGSMQMWQQQLGMPNGR